jgi:hypothetical protein
MALMRLPICAILVSLALALDAPSAVTGATRTPGVSRLAVRMPSAAADHSLHSSTPPQSFREPSPVGMAVSVGYLGQYRPSAWVPVRITLQNHTAAQVTGTVMIPDSGGGNQYSIPSYASMYSESVVLPARDTKLVTLYLPGEDVGDQVNVWFRVGTQVIARGSDSPSSASDSILTIGTLTGDPQLATWIRRAKPRSGSVDMIGLTPATLDPVAQALATFDAIVLTNVDSARLTRDQLTALSRYVQAGGSLVLVGGPDWQETLRPLPRTLVPGTLAGARTLPNLSGLHAVGASGIPENPTIVSRLVHPTGSVLAQQAGIPLIVRNHVGLGRIIYLAFDPSVDPIASWRHAGELTSSLVRQATPQVINRLAVSGSQSGIFTGRFGAGTIRQELANVPGATEPTFVLLVILVLLSILILGPLNFLVFRRLRRPEVAWFAIPLLALGLLAAGVNTTLHFKGNLVLLNTVGVVEMNGSSETYPATLYVGLFSSVRGAYHVVYNGHALTESLPEYSFNGTSPSSALPVGVNLSEGARTTIDFPSMGMWSTRSVALWTTVHIAGSVHGSVQVAPDGTLVGTIRNDTDFTLMAPAILAGSAVRRLANLPPHTARTVQIQPFVDIRDHGPILLWDRIYGTSLASAVFGAWDGDPWEEPKLGSEVSFTDRLRNVGDRLPGGEDLPTGSGVVLLGWTEASLGSLTVDGVIPRRRDLNLIETSLPVHFPRGTFQLRPGTLSAYLVDGRAQAPQNGCCSTSLGSQVVGVGSGGSATFQFDIPNSHHLHFHRLVLSVNAGGADGSKVAQVYDWHKNRWVHVDLGSNDAVLTTPARYISSAGALQIRLHATSSSGDIMITDPLEDVQLSGTATVE